MLVLLDSGILLRLVNRSDPQHATVRAALRFLKQRGDVFAAAPQNMAEFWNVCTRPALMLAQGISHILTFNTGDFSRYPKIVAQTPADVLKNVSASPTP